MADRSPGRRRGPRGRAGAWVLLAAIVGALLPALLAAPAGAHTPHDTISDVQVSPDGHVYVLAANRLLVSAPGDYHWRQLVVGLPRAPEDGSSLRQIAISPSDAQRIYLTAQEGSVFRSDDAGATWRLLTGGPSVATGAIAVAPTDPDVVLVAGAISGMWRTTDGGRTWTQLPGFRRVPAIAFIPGSNRAVAAGGDGQASISDDLGATWKVATRSTAGGFSAIGVGGKGATASVYLGTTEGRISRSTDGGSTFAPLDTRLPVDVVRSIAVAGDRVWVSLAEHGVYRSTDGGTTFAKSSKGLTTDMQAHVVKSDEFRTVVVQTKRGGGRVLWSAGFDGLSRSTDDGTTWKPSETLVDYVSGLGVSPDYAHDRTVAAAGYVKGMYLSSDSGDEWKAIDHGLEHQLSAGNKFAPVKRLHNVVFSPDYARDGTIFSASWTSFLKTTDRGATWKEQFVNLGDASGELRQFVIALSPHYTTDRTIFMGSRQGDVYRSRKAGNTGSWEKIGNAGSRVRNIVVDPSTAQPTTLYAGSEQGVVRSDDGGVTWARTGPGGLSMVAISPDYADDGTVFAGTADGLFVTTDRGASWSPLDVVPGGFASLGPGRIVEALAVSPAYAQDGTVFVSVTGDALYRSTDRGATFAKVGDDLVRDNAIVSDFTNPSAMAIQISPAYATDGTVFAFSGMDVLRSRDRGDSWTVLHLPSAESYLKTVDPALMHFAGGHGGHGASTPSTKPAAKGDGRDRDTYVAVAGAVLVGLLLLGAGTLFAVRQRRYRRAREARAATDRPDAGDPPVS